MVKDDNQDISGMARFDLLTRFGSEAGLREALSGSEELRRYAGEELAGLTDDICARDFVSRQYRGMLRRVLNLDTTTDAEIEAAHEARMLKIMAELNKKDPVGLG